MAVLKFSVVIPEILPAKLKFIIDTRLTRLDGFCIRIELTYISKCFQTYPPRFVVVLYHFTRLSNAPSLRNEFELLVYRQAVNVV